jgi:hypothetical protein
MGRSSTINGAYTDLDGNSLLTPTSGGTLLMGRDYPANFASSGTDVAPVATSYTGSVGREIGPGHIGISPLSDGIERVTYHYYDGNTTNGEPTLGLKSLIWGIGGWPRPGWNLTNGAYAIGTRLTSTSGQTTALFLDASSGTPRLATWTGYTSQLWDLTRVDNNRYTVASRSAAQNLAITASTTTGNNRAIGLIAANATSTLQRWFIEQTNDLSFRMLNVSAGTAMRVTGATASAGTGIETYAYGAGLSEQRWFITPAGAFRIKGQMSGLYLNAAGMTTTSNINQQAKADSNYQYWRFVPTPDGYTKILNAQTGLAMTVASSSATNGAAVRQETDASSSAQQWSLDILTDGSFRLVPKVSGKALEVASASTAAGALVQQGKWNHTLNQQFSLEQVTSILTTGGTSGTGGSSGVGGTASSGGTTSTTGTTAKGGTSSTGTTTVSATGGTLASGGSNSTSSGGSSIGAGGTASSTGSATSPGSTLAGGSTNFGVAGSTAGASSAIGGGLAMGGMAAVGGVGTSSNALAGATGSLETTGDDGGCGCRVAGSAQSPTRNLWSLLAVVGAAVVGHKRRRSRR